MILTETKFTRRFAFTNKTLDRQAYLLPNDSRVTDTIFDFNQTVMIPLESNQVESAIFQDGGCYSKVAVSRIDGVISKVNFYSERLC